MTDKTTAKPPPIFLTPETSRIATTSKGYDARCIVCLEACYIFWIEEGRPPAGCPFGHTDPAKCVEHALPHAQMRADFAELRKKGLLR